MAQPWPRAALKEPFKEKRDQHGNLIFRGPRDLGEFGGTSCRLQGKLVTHWAPFFVVNLANMDLKFIRIFGRGIHWRFMQDLGP
eukprot:scaffold116052_cov17-Tisochrysis_lutea.AAC.1